MSISKFIGQHLTKGITIAVIIGIGLIVKGNFTSDVKAIQSLCDIEDKSGQVISVGGTVVKMGEGLSGNDHAVNIEENGQNCGTTLNINESPYTSPIQIGDYVQARGEASAFGITVKNYDVNPSDQAESTKMVKVMTISYDEIDRTEDGNFWLGMAANGGGGMIIPKSLRNSIHRGRYDYKFTYTLTEQGAEASHIEKLN